MKKLGCIFMLNIIFIICGCRAVDNISISNSFDTMRLVVEPGSHWLSSMKIFLFISTKNAPQMAAWIADAQGKYMATILITERSAKKNWRSSPKGGRPEALPVWTHARQGIDSADSIDSVTTATPKGAINAGVDTKAFVSGNTYNIYFEIDHSFDYNSFWTKANSGVNGQPSVIYHARFTAGNLSAIGLAPIGHGSVDGHDGAVAMETQTLDTALEIAKSVRLQIRGGL